MQIVTHTAILRRITLNGTPVVTGFTSQGAPAITRSAIKRFTWRGPVRESFNAISTSFKRVMT